mgnify:CR=1 FL=1|tara:strand:- start:16694 stop:18361 length:1668 start_codon:yes stop_codon:yes gene_type:complete
MKKNKAIKIGIFSKEFNKLRNFEYRIIKRILDDPSLELKVLIFDGRKHKSSNGVLKKLINEATSKKIISKVILKIQELIELALFKIPDPLDKDKIITSLKKIDCVSLYPEKKGFFDIFTNNDINKIKNYDLDIILRHEFNIIKGEILNFPKHGIWSFHHADNNVNRGGPSCFWEVLKSQQSVGVTLQKLTNELDGGIVIDKGFYNIDWSWIKTRNIVLESSVNLLFKNLNRLKNNKLKTKKSSLYYYRLYKSPNLINVFRYILLFYSRLVSKIFKKILTFIFSKKYSHWSIIISKGDFLDTVLHRLKSIKSPKNEFWADPFIFHYKGNNYVFFENYEYDKAKGKISCGKIRDNNLIDIKDVLVLPYHLSYPNIFYYENDIYMIPETHENKRLEIYKCESFPDKWELYSTGFEGERIADCNFYEDINKVKWLFLNKHEPELVGHSDLYIYQIDSLKLKDIKPHNDNPVIINTNNARNAGPIFNYNSRTLRPSQICNEGIYGRGLSINEIKELTLNNYSEIEIERCLPYFLDNIKGVHHLHQTDQYFAIDVCYGSRR